MPRRRESPTASRSCGYRRRKYSSLLRRHTLYQSVRSPRSKSYGVGGQCRTVHRMFPRKVVQKCHKRNFLEKQNCPRIPNPLQNPLSQTGTFISMKLLSWPVLLRPNSKTLRFAIDHMFLERFQPPACHDGRCLRLPTNVYLRRGRRGQDRTDRVLDVTIPR